jgi:hypothetical protein
VLLNCTEGKQLIARLMELSMRAATDVEKRDDSAINPLAPPPEIVSSLSFDVSSQYMFADRTRESIYQDEVEIVGQIMSMLLACCLSSVDLLQAFLENPTMDPWLTAILLGSPEAKIREKTISTLYKLCTIVNEEYVTTPIIGALYTIVGKSASLTLLVLQVLGRQWCAVGAPAVLPGEAACHAALDQPHPTALGAVL